MSEALPRLPSAAVRGAAQELRAASAHARSSQTKSKKIEKGVSQLKGLSSDISKNELAPEAASEAYCVSAKSISDIAHRRADASPDGDAAKPAEPAAAAAAESLEVVAPCEDAEMTDARLIEAVAATQGRGVLFMRNVGGTIDAFVREYNVSMREQAKRQREEERAKGPAALPAATSPAKPKRPTPKKPTAAALQAQERAVPSLVSSRYPAAQLPLYSPAAPKGQVAAAQAVRIEPGSRYLRSMLMDSNSPGWVYHRAISVTALRAILVPSKRASVGGLPVAAAAAASGGSATP